MKEKSLGNIGEQLARDYLVARGYAIREMNARIGHLEIDIVAMHGNRIVFVEVKTRTAASPHPLDAVTPRKIQRLCTAADAYVRAHNIPHPVQFDIIAIVVAPDGSTSIEHIPDAFFPPLRTYR